MVLGKLYLLWEIVHLSLLKKNYEIELDYRDWKLLFMTSLLNIARTEVGFKRVILILWYRESL